MIDPLRYLALIGCLLATTAHADLAPEDLARKNERGYFTGLPLFAYTTDLGFGAGARGYYYWNGRRGDPRFATTPYLHRVFVQVFGSTRGLQFHWIDYDAPAIFETPFRVRSQLILQRNINQNYFGIGSRGLVPLAFPGAPGTFDTYADYSTEQRRVQADGTTWGKYDQYHLLRPIGIASIERVFLDGHLHVLGGLGFTWARIKDYTGDTIDAVDDAGDATTAPMGTTRLRMDCDAGLLVGCDGGRDNYLRVGVSYDTRDFEPDPNRGIYTELAIDVGTRALASEYDYVRMLAVARGYWSPFPERADLVLAGRALFQISSAGIPFFGMNTLPFLEDPRAGLGGHRTLRGYRQDRFVGPVMALANAELRWTFGHAQKWNQKFAFFLVPVFDVGRSFDSVGDFGFSGWRASYGGAVRVSWNLATIVTFDYGRSSEDSGFYGSFSHQF